MHVQDVNVQGASVQGMECAARHRGAVVSSFF